MRLAIAAAVALLAASAAAGPQYVYAHGNTQRIISAGKLDLARIHSLQRRYGNDFLWARVDGRDYVIRDEATLDEVEKLYAPLDGFSREHEALQRRMRPLERREEDLEERMDALADDGDRDPDLEREQRDVERRLHELEAEEERLDRRQDEIERQAERALEQVIRRAIERGVAERV